MSDNEKWFYDPSSGQVTQGKEGAWDDRMGPYDSREEAENAISIAKARNEEADAMDKDDEEWNS